MGIPRAPESPCRVLQSIDWEGEQALFELTLVDAPHCDRLRTDQAGQRQGAMDDPSITNQQLSGDVRLACAFTQHVHTTNPSERLLHRLLSLARARELHRPRRHCIGIWVFLIQL